MVNAVSLDFECRVVVGSVDLGKVILSRGHWPATTCDDSMLLGECEADAPLPRLMVGVETGRPCRQWRRCQWVWLPS